MEKALIYATTSYEGKDRTKLMHALELMLLMKSDEEREAALLKDILSVKTVDEIREAGFSESTIAAIEAMSRRPREIWKKYMERIRENTIASIVMHGAQIIFISDTLDGSKRSAAKQKELNQSMELLDFLNDRVRKEGIDE